jgi:hypothetical protein
MVFAFSGSTGALLAGLASGAGAGFALLAAGGGLTAKGGA